MADETSAVNEPLDDLFVDETATPDKGLLRDILKKYVQLTASGEIHFLPSYDTLKNAQQKILIILLSKKAISLKTGSPEKIAPKEIQTISGLPKGTVNPTLTALEEKKAARSENGFYFVPNYAVTRIKGLFKDD